MTTKNIIEFLQTFPFEDLKRKGILTGKDSLLMGKSITPLFTLMRENSVDRLEHPELKWFLDVEGNFKVSVHPPPGSAGVSPAEMAAKMAALPAKGRGE